MSDKEIREAVEQVEKMVCDNPNCGNGAICNFCYLKSLIKENLVPLGQAYLSIQGFPGENGLGWAKLFHDTYEELAPRYGYETRKDTKGFDPTSPNGQLMIATCEKVIGQALRECRLAQIKAMEGLGEFIYKWSGENHGNIIDREHCNLLAQALRKKMGGGGGINV